MSSTEIQSLAATKFIVCFPFFYFTQQKDVRVVCFKFVYSDSEVLFAHQSSWQQALMHLYGNYVVLIDATYRTTVYDLPLFMLSVPTNCGYVVVASFVTVDEQTESIAAALRMIHQWNPEWQPTFVFTDFSESQIRACQSVFTG